MTTAPRRTPDRRTLLRAEVIGGCILAAVAASVLAVALSADGTASLAGRVGGDFPAFYGAGTIVADGDAADLYDPAVQQRTQAEVLGLFGDDADDGFLYFAYPPPVALGYAVLSLLPYRFAYLLHTMAMAGALVAAFGLLHGLGGPRPRFAVAAGVAVLFVPIAAAVLLGQNSAVVVLLLAASWRFASDGRPGLAGVALGLLLFKPQYAIPMLGLHAVRGRPRVLIGAGSTAVGWWLVGAGLSGVGWVTDWIEQVREFTERDAEVNGANSVSWLGILEHRLGVGDPVALTVGAALIVLTAAVLIRIWWRRADHDLALPMAAAAPGILLTSPHAMYYDASVLVLVLVGLSAASRRVPVVGIAVAVALAAFHGAKDQLGGTPVGLVVVVAFAYAVLQVVRAPARSTAEDAQAGHGPHHATVLDLGGPALPDADLSVIIPAFDERGRIEPTIEALEAWVRDGTRTVEILVVDDGSLDGTAEAAIGAAGTPIRVLRLPENRGKGHAVRVGMLAASGRWCAFLDADGSTAPDQLDVLLAPGEPVVIGSVAAGSASVARAQPGIRAGLGRFGNTIIQALVLPGIEDSQRGCKVFRADVVDAVFPACRVDGWGFDVEVLARCRAAGHEPLEVGVVWEHRPVGHVRPWHYLTTILEVVRIRAIVGRQPSLTTSVRSPT